MTEIRHERVNVGKISLHVACAGGNDARLIIFLHGFPESWASWRPYLHAFAASSLVVAPDNRGFNESDKPASLDDYQMACIVDDIFALARHYSGSRFTLIGHDWGGIAAWHFAARYPQLLERLVILNAPHPVLYERELAQNAAQRAAAQYVNRFRDPGCEARLINLGLEQFWTNLFGHHLARGQLTLADKQAALEAWSKPGALTAMLNWYRASAAAVLSPSAPLQRISNQTQPTLIINVPTLVIWGMQDQLLLPCLLDGLDQYVPQLTIERLATASHGLIHEQAETIISLIQRWMCAI